nr:MAG: nonstructural protein [Microvirus sp.]
MKLFAIRDTKGQFYGNPWTKRTPGEAERDFTQLAQDPQSTIHKFPQDYDLYELGDFDENTGKITPLDTPHHIAKAVDCSAKH